MSQTHSNTGATDRTDESARDTADAHRVPDRLIRFVLRATLILALLHAYIGWRLLPDLPGGTGVTAAGIAVGLVTAPGGRDQLVPALVARGATVRRADVYRREPVAFSPSAIDRLLAAEGPLVLAVSSGQALQHAIERLPADALTRLRAGRAVAASARLAALTHRCGFADVAVAPGPRPAQLLSVLADGGGTAR